MSEESNTQEQTQPIRVKTEEPKNDQSSQLEELEGIEARADGSIPEWLLNFASQPAEETSIKQEAVREDSAPVGIEHLEENPEPVDLDETEVAEWEEAPVEETAELVESVEEALEAAPIDQSELLDQDLEETDPGDLLKQGLYQEAAELLRAQASTPEEMDQAARQLRSHLLLRSEAAPLWSLYDELQQRADELNPAQSTNSQGD